MEKVESWAILELMGHVRLAGRVSEEEKFGAKMGRIDVPDGDGFTTRYFGGQSVYSMTPVTEEVARHVAKNVEAAPVHTWDFPKPALPAPVYAKTREDYEDDREEDEPEEECQFPPF